MLVFLLLYLETCVNVNGVALKGQKFRWVDANGNSANISGCQYTGTPAHFISQGIPFPGTVMMSTYEQLIIILIFCTHTESPSPLDATGVWNFECTDGSANGTVSVVRGLHIVLVTASVPQDCYVIGVDDVVLWVNGDNQTCEKSIIVESDTGIEFTSNITDGKEYKPLFE